ncbi:MAG: hypothetical protein GY765_24900, partial [bacterium]|nr:hypothetical protein [bacterium]
MGFLQKLAETFIERCGGNLHRNAFVFPNRRSCLYFLRHLETCKPEGATMWTPPVFSIGDFMARLSDLTIQDPLDLIFELYAVYGKHVSNYQKQFEDFYPWGKMILSDFNEIDKYLVDTSGLFKELRNFKDIEDINKEEQTEIYERYTGFWGEMGILYREFNLLLRGKDKAYEGMLYRETAENIETMAKGRLKTIARDKVIFCGFNALSKSEEVIIKYLLDHNLGETYWDMDYYFVEDRNQEAGYFFRKNVKSLQLSQPDWLESRLAWKKNIDIIGVQSKISQAKVLGLKLRQLYGDAPEEELFKREGRRAETTINNKDTSDGISDGISDDVSNDVSNDASNDVSDDVSDDASNDVSNDVSDDVSGDVSDDTTQSETFENSSPGGEAEMSAPDNIAVVLPDETLLFPLLNSLPDCVDSVNVTVGFPLRQTPVYSLFSSIIDMHLRRIENEATAVKGYYYKDIKRVLNHPYIKPVAPDEISEFIEQLRVENRAYVKKEDLSLKTAPLPDLFEPRDDSRQLIAYFLEVLDFIRTYYEDAEENIFHVDYEFIYHFYTLLSRLRDSLEHADLLLNIAVFSRLFTDIVSHTRLPFTGEPLEGLQIMGLLETRALDFNHLYILSVNEGHLPPARRQDSFIPYVIRVSLGLPTYKDRDAIAAYHFYRLLKNSRNVTLLYLTEAKKGVEKVEKSRFIDQILIEYAERNADAVVRHQIIDFPFDSHRPGPIDITKNGTILAILKKKKY